jgi:hypothetical protein
VDSGDVVGKDARSCSLPEITPSFLTQLCKTHEIFQKIVETSHTILRLALGSEAGSVVGAIREDGVADQVTGRFHFTEYG